MPVVANGKVYVAAYQSLTIFGPGSSPAISTGAAIALEPNTVAAALPLNATRRVSGTLLAIDGTTLTLLTRVSRTVQVDASLAVESKQVANLIVGQPYTALGDSTESTGILRAVSVTRAKRGSGAWPEDHE